MSRPYREPCSHKPQDILNALRNGKTLKELALRDRQFPYPSRLAMCMTECGSDAFYKKLDTVRRETNPNDDAEMRKGFDTVVKRWKLFKRNPKTGRLDRNYRRGEKSDEFKERVRKTIDAQLAVLWILADIVGGPRIEKIAPHSLANFAGETGRSVRKVSECVNTIVEGGYVARYGTSKMRSLYVRPDSEILIYSLDEKYGDYSVGKRPRVPRRWAERSSVR